MIITMHCHVSVNTSAVNEDVQVEVPDNFFELSEAEQYKELEQDFNDWLGSNLDSGYSFSAITKQ